MFSKLYIHMSTYTFYVECFYTKYLTKTKKNDIELIINDINKSIRSRK